MTDETTQREIDEFKARLRRERDEFKAQLAAGTDGQVQRAYYAESAAGREAYLDLIKAEAAIRRIDLLDNDGEIVPNFENLRSVVTGDARSACLTRHFGRFNTQLESAVHEFMRQLCPGDAATNGEGRYRGGGFWEYYELCNGAFYMAPMQTARMRLVSENGSSEEISADGAGVVACLYAMSHLSFVNEPHSDNEKMIEHYHLLRELIMHHHPEATAIARLTD